MSLKDKGNIITGMKNKVVIPEGVSFDGVTDYMSRSTDLVGNVDSSTFTFSCCVYHNGKGTEIAIYSSNYFTFMVYIDGLNILHIEGANTGGTAILNMNTGISIEKNTWINMICSVDLTNVVNRSIYINDKLATPNWSTYTNGTLDFTSSLHSIGAMPNANFTVNGRLSHLFLSYDYIDLSIVANRRIFITSEGNPA